MKKLFSGILAACMLSSCFAGMSPVWAAKDSAEAADPNVASVVFGAKNDTTTNITSVKAVGSASSTTISGTPAKQINRILNMTKTTDSGRILINLDDDFFCGNTDGTEFVVTVKYVDAGNGHFTLLYDSLYGEKYTETVYAGLTNGVKEAVFTLSDANFANGISSGDLMICFPNGRTRSARSAYISEVTVEKITAKTPVMVNPEGTVAGNVYNFKKPVTFKNTFTNYTDEEKTVEVTYIIQNELGNVESTRTESMTFAPREVKTLEDTPEHEVYGKFYYDVNIKDDSMDFTGETRFSYINTAKDGLRADRFLFCSNDLGELGGQAAEFVDMANAGGIRSNYGWHHIETSYGSYEMTESTYKPKLDYLREHGMKYFGIVGYGGAHNVPYGNLPDTDEGLQGMVDYISYCVDYMGVENSQIELWNEPNLSSFAANITPEIYAWNARQFSEKLRERYPDLEIAVLALCDLTSEISNNITDRTIESGAFDFANGASFHPYYLTNPETGRNQNMVYDHMKKIWGAGYTDIKIYNSEIGWTTTLNDAYPFTERQVAAYHPRYYFLWDVEPMMQNYCAYTLVDPGNTADEREDNFGMMDNGENPAHGIKFLAQEAYVSLANMNNIIAGAEKPVKVETGVNNIYAYQVRNDARGEDILAFWKALEEQKETIHVNLGAKSVRLVDSFGNETVLESENGEYDLLPDFDISYIIGNFGNVSIAPSNMSFAEVIVPSISEDIISVNITGIENADSVELREDGFGEIVSGAEVVGGKADVRLQLPALRNDLSSFWLLLKKDGKTVSAVRLYCEKSNLYDTSLSADLTTRDYTAWNGYLAIRNNSQRNALSGYAKIVEVNGEETKLGETYTGPITPGTSSQIKLPMPKIYERNLKDIKYRIMFKDGTVFEYTETLNFAFAPYAKTRPTIDGKWDAGEWEDNTSFYANEKSQVKKITDWAGKDDLSAEIKTAWDYDNFYITVKVKDNIYYQEDTGEYIWKGDSLQFGLLYGKETYVAFGNFGSKYSEFGAAKTSAGDEMFRWMSEDEQTPKGPVENYECVITRDESDKTTLYEIALPWTEILPQNIEKFDPTDRALGFSLLVNDNDKNGRRGWIEFASGIGEGKDTSLFTYLNLINVE